MTMIATRHLRQGDVLALAPDIEVYGHVVHGGFRSAHRCVSFLAVDANGDWDEGTLYAATAPLRRAASDDDYLARRDNLARLRTIVARDAMLWEVTNR